MAQRDVEVLVEARFRLRVFSVFRVGGAAELQISQVCFADQYVI